MKASTFFFFFLGLSTLCLFIPELIGANLEDSGIKGIIYWSCQILSLPFWFTQEALTALISKNFPALKEISIALVWTLSYLIYKGFKKI